MDENNVVVDEKKTNKKNILIISLLVFVIIGLGFYICIDKGIIFGKETEDNKQSKSSSKEPEPKNTESKNIVEKNENIDLKNGYYVFKTTSQADSSQALEYILKINKDGTFELYMEDIDILAYSGEYNLDNDILTLQSTRETLPSSDVYSSTKKFIYKINESNEITSNVNGISVSFAYTELKDVKDKIDNYFKNTTVRFSGNLKEGYYSYELNEIERSPEGLHYILYLSSDGTFKLLKQNVEEIKLAGKYEIKDEYLVLNIDKQIQMDDTIVQVSNVEKYHIISSDILEQSQDDEVNYLKYDTTQSTKTKLDNSFAKFNI